MRTTLLVLLLLTSAIAAEASVWKWVDSDGVTHYSDRPVPGATRIELGSINQMNTAGPTPPAATSSTPTTQAEESYRAFEVSSPAPEQAIINTGGQVAIALQLEPALRPGHTLSVYLDGQLVSGSPGTALQYTASNVPRGEHTVTAVISDASGQRIAAAADVRFYVRQTAITNPQTGSTGGPAPPPTQPATPPATPTTPAAPPPTPRMPRTP